MDKIEKHIGLVMRISVIAAFSVLIVGIVLTQEIVMKAGILILILTPILRVITSIISFVACKDKLYTLITIVVLVILALSVIVGMYLQGLR